MARSATGSSPVTQPLRVLSSAPGHPYDVALYAPLAGRVVHAPLPGPVFDGDPAPLGGWDQFHLHWPERLLPCVPARHRAVIAALKAGGVRIVWTQHNLVPHARDREGETVYRAWAAAADAVVHHSEWGMARAVGRYAYGPGTGHWVIPHGHFGHLMREAGALGRHEAERRLGLRHGVLRLGVIGAPRREKRVDLVMRAVAASRRSDIELYVLSLAPGERACVADPRIVALPYERVPRAEYNRRLATVDVLVLPFEDGEMLTTGTVGDAVGLGLPSLVSRWPFLREALGDAGICYGSTAEDLTRCVDSLDEATLRRARRAARRLQETYSWDIIAERHLAVLENTGSVRR